MDHVIPDTPLALQTAVANFVATRRALSDRELRPPWFQAWKQTVDPHVFVDGSIPGDYACPPEATMATVLPFFDLCDTAESNPKPALVPVRFVVGSSWRWNEDSLPHDLPSVESAVELFTSEQCARFGGIGARVTQIEPLGLFYVSGEGKNRVAFLARNGVEFMPCMVSERTYPSADRMRLIAVREGPMCCWVCVLDDEYAVALAYPELTLPILRAYGVKQSKWRDQFPLQGTVMNSFRLQPVDTDSAIRNGPTAAVSLSHLRRREDEVKHQILSPSPLLAHDEVALDTKRLLRLFGYIAAAFFLGSGMQAFSISEHYGTQIAFLGLGAIFGAIGVLLLPVAIRPEKQSKQDLAVRAADGRGSADVGLEHLL